MPSVMPKTPKAETSATECRAQWPWSITFRKFDASDTDSAVIPARYEYEITWIDFGKSHGLDAALVDWSAI
ncbi:MAG: hypothetical protein Q9222_003838 [Ikaeria aurantiellina]